MKRAAGKVQEETAQGVIEFALIVSIMMLIFLGTVDYGRFLYYDTSLQNAARVGAETAQNHCASQLPCGQDTSVVTDDFVVQSTSCAAAGSMTLLPQPTTCSPASCTSHLMSSCTSPCTGTCLSNVCVQDICVNPLAASRTYNTLFTVTVGYSFKPISFLMSPFFNDRSCFTGDSSSSNHHTLCASAVGRVDAISAQE